MQLDLLLFFAKSFHSQIPSLPLLYQPIHSFLLCQHLIFGKTKIKCKTSNPQLVEGILSHRSYGPLISLPRLREIAKIGEAYKELSIVSNDNLDNKILISTYTLYRIVSINF